MYTLCIILCSVNKYGRVYYVIAVSRDYITCYYRERDIYIYIYNSILYVIYILYTIYQKFPTYPNLGHWVFWLGHGSWPMGQSCMTIGPIYNKKIVNVRVEDTF